jgi:hypothetical protein
VNVAVGGTAVFVRVNVGVPVLVLDGETVNVRVNVLINVGDTEAVALMTAEAVLVAEAVGTLDVLVAVGCTPQPVFIFPIPAFAITIVFTSAAASRNEEYTYGGVNAQFDTVGWLPEHPEYMFELSAPFVLLCRSQLPAEELSSEVIGLSVFSK